MTKFDKKLKFQCLFVVNFRLEKSIWAVTYEVFCVSQVHGLVGFDSDYLWSN